MTALLDRKTTAGARAARPNGVLGVLLLGQFMAILDVSIVNVAAPTLRSDLHASGAGLQLAIAGYTISYAVLLITGARLGDRLGHGRAFRAGLAGIAARRWPEIDRHWHRPKLARQADRTAAASGR